MRRRGHLGCLPSRHGAWVPSLVGKNRKRTEAGRLGALSGRGPRRGGGAGMEMW